ncbi:MAG: histidinol-phosphatase [Ignavibacteriales bacterium CG_4_9_14_3_um_filter_30_11]|nr:MAG: histidinol-phosphatase [Ignavibacteriales bacterium CG_4_9_14_3_um_filter_30_11]
MYEYIGALHIHSVYSDGTGTVEEIINYAQEVGLDYLILTDHNTIKALKDGYEGWYGNTLFLVGCELNDKENKNHYLSFGIEDSYSTRLPAKEYVKKVKEAGGIGFLAHPHEKRKHMEEHPPYPWTEWDCSDFNGIEIWNHMSEWMENLTEEKKYQAFVHPLKSIEAPQKETLEKWDELNLERPVVGIGGVDAHAHKHNILGFFEVEIFPYKVLFKSIRTHILLYKELKNKNDFITAKKLIYEALKKGNCFIANDYRCDSKGFRFYAEINNKNFMMGETIPFESDVKLKILLPAKDAEIRLFCNGKLVEKKQNFELNYFVKTKGVYRVEIYYQGHAWIYSNHIRIL